MLVQGAPEAVGGVREGRREAESVGSVAMDPPRARC